jgi:hypothetical protein
MVRAPNKSHPSPDFQDISPTLYSLSASLLLPSSVQFSFVCPKIIRGVSYLMSQAASWLERPEMHGHHQMYTLVSKLGFLEYLELHWLAQTTLPLTWMTGSAPL